MRETKLRIIPQPIINKQGDSFWDEEELPVIIRIGRIDDHPYRNDSDKFKQQLKEKGIVDFEEYTVGTAVIGLSHEGESR